MNEQDASQVRCYFARTPEKLVLDGCRIWQSRNELGNEIAQENLRRLYFASLEPGVADVAAEAMSVFMASLSRCAVCPMSAFPAGSHYLTRDEVLLLGLIAGIQHGDELVARTCLDRMTCPSRCEEVSAAAANFAITLRSLGHRLMPIPLHAIEDVLVRSRTVTIH